MVNNSKDFKSLRDYLSKDVPKGNSYEISVRRIWWAALENIQEELLLQGETEKGLWLAAPLPALYEPKLLKRLDGWVWAPENLETFTLRGGALPSSGSQEAGSRELVDSER